MLDPGFFFFLFVLSCKQHLLSLLNLQPMVSVGREAKAKHAKRERERERERESMESGGADTGSGAFEMPFVHCMALEFLPIFSPFSSLPLMIIISLSLVLSSILYAFLWFLDPILDGFLKER